MRFQFSDNVESLQPSAIREILKFTSMPGVISFAAGNPAPEAFPTETVAEISRQLLMENPVLAMQYSITEGYPELRTLLKERLAKDNAYCDGKDELIITSGAQQANELACKVLLNRGDTLICEAPSFIGSINAFKSYGVKLVGIPLQDDGMDMDALENTLKTEQSCKLIYVIPNFQNPTGGVMSLAKRKRLYELACEYDVLILEDNPYGDLRYDGENVPSIKSMDIENRVIYSGTFSKILAPGFRTGYVSAPAEIISKMTVCKQVADVHSNIWAQAICERFMRTVDMDEHLNNLRNIYRRKRDIMLSEMENTFSKQVTYTKPEGGLFIWCTLPESCDMNAFCQKSVQEYKIALVPGNAFLINESDKTTSFRMNFSTPTDEQLTKGTRILGAMTKEVLGE
ncbi:MAG: PLP-dependent aminotransferase family protein [Ruminococcus sp.]|nr:PLP-dependent aminotransferase family protein [Ruminococcus sp.]